MLHYSDVGKVLWAVCYGSNTNYPTQVKGAQFVDQWTWAPILNAGEGSHYHSIGKKQMYDTLMSFSADDIIPQQLAAEHVHSMGIKFELMFRLGILGRLPRKTDDMGIVAQHPEYRQILRDGTVIEKASYAFPEVQQLMLDLIREATEKIDADGINLCFVRGPHLLCYEKSILDAFQAKYGEDAREVEPKDSRLLEVRASFMTDFVRKARRVLDEVGTKKGKRLELSIWAWHSNQNVWLGKTPIEEGLDIKTWIRESLLDSLVCQGVPVDTDYMDLCQIYDCKYIFGYSFGGKQGEAGTTPEIVSQMYKAGVEHFVYWDVDGFHINPEMWSWIRRIGHREEMENWDYDAHKIRSISINKIDGVDVLQGLAGAVYSGG